MAKTMAELLALFPNNPTILDAAIKTEDHISRQAQQGGKIMVSVSGGSDSDIIKNRLNGNGVGEGRLTYLMIRMRS
jgi:predicted PP-loop superfamily ATPase